MLSPKNQMIVDTIQWVLIVVLLIACGIIYYSNKRVKGLDAESRQNATYVKIYESQRLKQLEKENAKLYDRIKDMENVESAVEIKYVYRYKTDTITKFVQGADSIYRQTYNNDTIKTDVVIKASDLKWCKVESEIHDTFRVINRESKGKVETYVDHNNTNVSVENLDTWHRKKPWMEKHFFHGPTVGIGYGVINQKPDIYVGYSIGFRF